MIRIGIVIRIRKNGQNKNENDLLPESRFSAIALGNQARLGGKRQASPDGDDDDGDDRDDYDDGVHDDDYEYGKEKEGEETSSLQQNHPKLWIADLPVLILINSGDHLVNLSVSDLSR